MNQTSVLLALCLLLPAGSSRVSAQTVTVLGTPAPFNVTTAVAGLQPAVITNAVTSIRVVGIQGAEKISAGLNAPMPAGTTLTILLAVLPGATTVGTVTLTTTVVMLEYDIQNDGTARITYTFSATAAAGVIPSQSRIVTFTLAAYP